MLPVKFANVPSKLLLLAVGFMLSDIANAYNFIPTETEWRTWPEYCRARYSSTTRARSTQYANTVSKDVQGKWQAAVGRETYNALHHYCAGLVYLQKLQFEPNMAKREELIKKARNEINYTYTRGSRSYSFFAEIAVNLSRVYNFSGDNEKALAILQDAISVQPSYDRTYTAMSIVYDELNQPTEQLEILLQGDEAMKGESAEIHYFLGLIYVDRGELENAAEHAQKAYDLGYPLDGLRRKLYAKGYTV